MAERIIRPTTKFIYLGYISTLLVAAVCLILLERVTWPASVPQVLQPWIPFLPLLLILWPIKRHLRNRVTKMTLLDDRLRYESGLASRTVRTILVTNVQDVTVRQTVIQRMFGVGDVTIETAGGSSRETIFNIDRPQSIADEINDRAKKTSAPNPSVRN